MKRKTLTMMGTKTEESVELVPLPLIDLVLTPSKGSLILEKSESFVIVNPRRPVE